MTDIVSLVQRTFENIKLTDDTGFEFWNARTLMTALGYKKWERFGLVVEKAMENCTNSGGDISEHFQDEREFFQEAGKTPKEVPTLQWQVLLDDMKTANEWKGGKPCEECDGEGIIYCEHCESGSDCKTCNGR